MAGEISDLKDLVHELQCQLEEKDAVIVLLRADHSARMEKMRERLHSLLEEVGHVRRDLRASGEEVTKICLRHSQLLERVMTSEAGRQEAAQSRVDRLQSQLLSGQEAVCRLEIQLKER